MTHVPLWRFYAYFLRLGATGFGGPVALAAFMQRDLFLPVYLFVVVPAPYFRKHRNRPW